MIFRSSVSISKYPQIAKSILRHIKVNIAFNKIIETLKNDSKNIQDACHILTTYRKQQRQLERIKHPIRSFKNIIKKIVK